MMDAVHRYAGTVNQVLGDGIMALFGAPVAHEDHAVRACYAALAMQAAMRAILRELATQARLILNDSFVDDIWDEAFSKHGPYGIFGEVLSRWAAHHPTPLVVLVDEIDALVGDALLALLRQLRAKYPWRPQHFPQSLVLCRVRDVRDYRIHSTQEKAIITGGSVFNIKAESLRLGDFSRPEVEALFHKSLEQTLTTGLDQTWAYMDRCAASAGHLVIFDRTPGKPWEEKLLHRQEHVRGHSIHVWGM